jgi:hypothetical protein
MAVLSDGFMVSLGMCPGWWNDIRPGTVSKLSGSLTPGGRPGISYLSKGASMSPLSLRTPYCLPPPSGRIGG